MKFLEYLYSKYYHLIGRLGKYYIAPFGAICILFFVLYLWALTFLFVGSSFFPSISNSAAIPYSLFLGFIPLYFIFLHKKKFKKIVERNENKSSLLAWLFTIGTYVTFILSPFLSDFLAVYSKYCFPK